MFLSDKMWRENFFIRISYRVDDSKMNYSKGGIFIISSGIEARKRLQTGVSVKDAAHLILQFLEFDGDLCDKPTLRVKLYR